jgi:hypothetical protein
VKGTEYEQTSVFHLPKQLTPGDYDVRIALADPTGKPQINLPIRGGDKDKRYKVGAIHIVPARVQKACDSAFCPGPTQ